MLLVIREHITQGVGRNDIILFYLSALCQVIGNDFVVWWFDALRFSGLLFCI